MDYLDAICFPKDGKYLTVTEGELDAMSAYELMGSKYAVVSLKNGANTKLSQEDKNYLDTFDKIVFCGDSDEPGRKAAQKFASLFGKNKVHIVKLSRFKDANEYHMEILRLENLGKQAEADELFSLFTREWWNAQPYTPDGLVQGKMTLDVFMNESNEPSIPYPWMGLQGMYHGIRTGELMVLTAGSGVGKSAIIRELRLPYIQGVTGFQDWLYVP